ncbi:hypothetical protein [Kribbella endophytica]
MSGTGPVAEGVQFTDGAVALRWYGDYPTTTVWDGIDSVIAIHGHSGATEVEWLDPDPGPDPAIARREDLPPQPWPELHQAPESEDEGPGPSLTRSDDANGSAGTTGAADRSGGSTAVGSAGTTGAADRSDGSTAHGSGGSTGSAMVPGQRATRPIFPAEHGSSGPVFPSGHAKEPFSEFMDNQAGPARRRTGFTDLL